MLIRNTATNLLAIACLCLIGLCFARTLWSVSVLHAWRLDARRGRYIYKVYYIGLNVFSIRPVHQASQNRIAILVLKNISNGTCGYQINPFGTSVKVPLIFLTECHHIYHGVIYMVSNGHVTWYLSFWVSRQIK